MKRLHLKRIFISICCFIIASNSIIAGDIYVDAKNGNDKGNGTFNEPVKTLAQAFRIAREWRRLKSADASNGITIHLRKGIHYLVEPLFIRPEDSGTPTSPTIVDGEGSWISGGVELKNSVKNNNIYEFDAPIIGTHPLEIRQLYYARLGISRATNIQNGGAYDRIIDFDKEKREIVIPTPANIEDLKKEKQIETEQLRDKLLSCIEGQEQYAQGIYYKVIDNTKDVELLFLNLTERLKIGKQNKGTDIIFRFLIYKLN